MPDTLAAHIRSTREAAGLTRRELAARSGLSEVYIEALEAGRRTSPTLAALTRLADVLGWDAARRSAALTAPAREG